jgi:hypothetical protein
MKHEAEDPTWHLFALRPLMSCPGSPDQVPCECDVFLGRWSIVPLNTAWVPRIRGPSMEFYRRVTERKVREICFCRENPVVALAHIVKDDGSRVRGQKMIEGTRKGLEGRCREWFQALHNQHLAIAYTDTTDEDFETLCKKGGVKIGEFHHFRKVI